MKRHGVALTALVVGLAAAPPALSIPAFARRYGVDCHFCHEGYPKLNSMGHRFKERGFRMEREEGFDSARWIAAVPLSVRASVNRFLPAEGDGTTFSFLRPVSAGNLGRRVSYWVDTGFLIHEGDDNFTHTDPDNAWVRFDVVERGGLYLKGGRFELDLPFTQTRTPHLFPYDVYFTTTGAEPDGIGGFQDGLEVGGRIGEESRWSAAVVKGRNREDAGALDPDADHFDANVFLRASRRAGRNRLGAFAYVGRNTLPYGPRLSLEDDLLRLGADASVWAGRLNLQGVLLYGRNSDSLVPPPSGARARSFTGGFVQADYHVRDEFVLNLRLNAVSRPPGRSPDKESFTGLFPGAQVFLFERLKLSFEYGFQNRNQADFGAVQAEIAF
jgi:hypothetical protein